MGNENKCLKANSEAVTRRCFVRKILYKTYRKNLSRSRFLLASWIKKRLQHRCFPVNFANSLKTPFRPPPPDHCFCNLSGLDPELVRLDNQSGSVYVKNNF